MRNYAIFVKYRMTLILTHLKSFKTPFFLSFSKYSKKENLPRGYSSMHIYVVENKRVRGVQVEPLERTLTFDLYSTGDTETLFFGDTWLYQVVELFSSINTLGKFVRLLPDSIELFSTISGRLISFKINIYVQCFYVRWRS